MMEALEVGGLAFEVRRSPRRKTFGLTVDRAGELVVHCPSAAANGELTTWVRSKLLWVHLKLALKEETAPMVRNPEFVSGESFMYLGRTFRLKIAAKQKEPLRFDGQRFSLRRDELPSAAAHFRAWYIATGKEWIARRVALLSKAVGAGPSRVDVSDLGFRWGSCGKNRVILFNWKLLQLPIRLADYVIVHELCHLVELNHNQEFWRTLERGLPDWKERQEALNMKAAEIHWCHRSME